ncbi:MAG: TniQ family protein [Limnobacter sp.]|uniref:TniQ family protein n=1 Tax=Limnobacter sp. TaxID=2003368 RepID=UPI004037AD96
MTHLEPWVIRPAPNSGELLSSYLIRISRAHGRSPGAFYRQFFPNNTCWRMDLDRNASERFLEDLSRFVKIDDRVLEDMTLRSWMENLDTKTGKSAKANVAVTPWINSLGVHKQSTRKHTLSFCPSCLKEKNFLRKEWRLSFVTVCATHRNTLIDGCPNCDAPFVYLGQGLAWPSCNQCGHSFLVQEGALDEFIFGNLCDFQHQLLRGLMDDKVVFFGHHLSAQEFFSGIYLVLRAVKLRLRILGNRPCLSLMLGSVSSKRVEFARVNERVHQCLLLNELIKDWPCGFLAICSEIGLSQRVFDDSYKLPIWLRSVVDQLKPGQSRIRKPQLCTVRKQLRQIHRRKTGDWRAERANLLLTKAGIQQ